MNELLSIGLFALGAVGTVVWYFGRQWFVHVDSALAGFTEADRRLHERLETERNRCAVIHTQLGERLSRIEGRLNGSK